MSNHGEIVWRSPSNLAIVKYWGKKEQQIPLNPSLSISLAKSYTETKMNWEKGNGEIHYLYEGIVNSTFQNKVIRFIKSLNLDWLNQVSLRFNSFNTFPHSAGIASSASSMSAIALCLASLEKHITETQVDFNQRASYLARLGSGSACRSIYPKASLWGKTEGIDQSSDFYGLDWSEYIHEDFRFLQDYIFIVNKNQKSVSSSAGHELMNQHSYKLGRINQAQENIKLLIDALKNGNWSDFIYIAEEEALSLHGLMMSSRPGYLLLEPESIKIINAIRQFRTETKLPLTFSVDAGPNIHMLFPSYIQTNVQSWLEEMFPDYLKESRIIYDCIGEGPIKLI